MGAKESRSHYPMKGSMKFGTDLTYTGCLTQRRDILLLDTWHLICAQKNELPSYQMWKNYQPYTTDLSRFK